MHSSHPHTTTKGTVVPLLPLRRAILPAVPQIPGATPPLASPQGPYLYAASHCVRDVSFSTRVKGTRDTRIATTDRLLRVPRYPSCLCAGPYFLLYPRYQGPRPLPHLRRARNMTLQHFTSGTYPFNWPAASNHMLSTVHGRTALVPFLRSCRVARRTVTPTPEALPPPALVQGMLQCMGVYRHRALPLPAKVGDARSTPAVHATALSHPCEQRSTVASGATPSCMRPQPGSMSVAFRAHTAEEPETALPCKRSRALMPAASRGYIQRHIAAALCKLRQRHGSHRRTSAPPRTATMYSSRDTSRIVPRAVPAMPRGDEDSDSGRQERGTR